MLAIIGGTGLTELENINITKRLLVRTPYGEPSQPPGVWQPTWA